MFKYRLYAAMGSDAWEVELAIPTLEPGETIRTGDGRKLLVLDGGLRLARGQQIPGLLTVEEVV